MKVGAEIRVIAFLEQFRGLCRSAKLFETLLKGLGFRDYLENKAKAWGNDERERKMKGRKAPKRRLLSDS
ncbi:MAG: hypothetical protein KBS55_02275 [Bacteroidales bacterium]|nr:hypothetical protein [Candidatus Cryptobacteroides aphodequi]